MPTTIRCRKKWPSWLFRKSPRGRLTIETTEIPGPRGPGILFCAALHEIEAQARVGDGAADGGVGHRLLEGAHGPGVVDLAIPADEGRVATPDAALGARFPQ